MWCKKWGGALTFISLIFYILVVLTTLDTVLTLSSYKLSGTPGIFLSEGAGDEWQPLMATPIGRGSVE